MVIMGLAYAWRLQAQQPTALPQPVPRGLSRAPALPVLAQVTDNETKDMGGTFYHLEGRAKRVTTRFADGAAIAARGVDGSITTRTSDSAGNEVGKLKVDPVGARDAEMLYETNGAPLFYAAVRPDVRPTLDWAAFQAHALRGDGHPTAVQWQGRFARSRGLKSGNLDDRAQEVVTEFDQDITAKTIRVTGKAGEKRRPHTLTRIYDGGVEVGEMAWVPSEKLLQGADQGHGQRGDAAENPVGRVDVPADHGVGERAGAGVLHLPFAPGQGGRRLGRAKSEPAEELAADDRGCSQSASVCRRRLRRSPLARQFHLSALLRYPRSLLRRCRLRRLVVVVSAGDVLGLHGLQCRGGVLLLFRHDDLDRHVRLYAWRLRLVRM
jgi:hypothetical protein